jgi:hypothetical protein
MTSLPEQLSAASTRQLSAQLDAQFRFFNTFATQALDNASRLISLNLSASRDSVERSSHTLRQLIEATQPRDLLVLRTHAEEQVRSLFNYGRELANITANAQPYGLRTIAAEVTALATPPAVLASVMRAAPIAEAAQEAPKAVVQAAEEASEQIEQAAGQISEAAAAPEPFVVEQAEPIAKAAEVQATVLEAPVPVSEQKPIAKAAGKGAPKAAAAPQPLAAPVEDKESTTVTRIGTPSKRRK